MGELLSKFGSFTKSTTTGNQTVTGIGFMPKVVFFFGTSKTSSGSAATIDASLGVAVSDDIGGLGDSMLYYASNNVATTVNNAGLADIRMFMRGDNTGNATVQGSNLTINTDGFTIKWNNNSGGAELICYLALGGAGITSTLSGTVNVGTTATSQNITGVPFQPEFAMNFASSSQNTTNSIGLKDLWGGFGATSEPSGQAAYMAHYFAHNTAAGSAAATSVLKAGKSFGQITTTQRLEGNITSFNANGYTINWTTHDAYDARHNVLLMAGGRYKVGTFQQLPATGTQRVTVGFRPSSIILFSANTANDAIANPFKFSFGAGTDSTNRGCMWFGAAHNTNPTDTDHDIDTTKIIKMMTATGTGSPSTQAAADLVSLDDTGFTLNWTTADTTQRQIAYIAFGSETVGDFAVTANTSSGFSINVDDGDSPTIALDTPDGVIYSTPTPALRFTGTDADSDDIAYHVQVSTSPTQSSVTLNGTSQAFSMTSNANIQPTGYYTIGAWIKHSISAGSGSIFQVYRQGWGVRLTTNSGYIFSWMSDTTGPTRDHGVQGSIFTGDNQWHFCVVTWDGTNHSVYVDGVLDIASPYIYPAAYWSTIYPRIGCGNETGTNQEFFAGSITGAFLINGTAWDLATINTNMHRDFRDAPNLVAYYLFGGNGNDASLYGHTMTAVGTPTYANTLLADVESATDPGFYGTPDNTSPFASGQQAIYTVSIPEENIDSEQNSTGTNFGFGEFSGMRYRGQAFTATETGTITKIGFARDKGSEGIKVYFDTVDVDDLPEHAVGSELYSFTITNANVIDEYGEYTLPVPLAVTSGTDYCFYLSPWDTTGDSYTDDYRDCRGISSGGRQLSYSGGWFTENLTFQYKVYVTSAVTLAPGQYFWQVRGIDPAGTNTYGEWAAWRSFTVIPHLQRHAFINHQNPGVF